MIGYVYSQHDLKSHVPNDWNYNGTATVYYHRAKGICVKGILRDAITPNCL